MKMSKGTGKVRDLKNTVCEELLVVEVEQFNSENREDQQKFTESLQIHKLDTQKHKN